MKKLLVAAVGLVALSACHYVGNGQVPTATGAGQFTFDINCPPGQNVATGNLTYVDRNAGVQIRGVPGTQYYFGAPCFSNGDGLSTATFTGSYQSATRSGGTGTFELTVTPPSDGTGRGGTFELTLTGGPNDGYHVRGPVTGHIKAIGGENA